MLSKDIKHLLNEHKAEIMAFDSKAERIEYIIRLVEEAYPEVSPGSALLGPIEDFDAAVNHIEIQPVLNILQELKTRESDTLVFVNNEGEDTEEIVKFIQHFIVQ